MSEPITAWRYWSIGHELEDVGDNLYSYRYHLRGDFEFWDGPLKQAGIHQVDSYERLFQLQTLRWVGAKDIDFDDPRISNHKSPHPDCLCGVNAVKRLRSVDLGDRTGNSPAIFSSAFRSQIHSVAFAQVDLGGRVEEYEEGYRAEYARIAGPIYVVNPPDNDHWQEQIERKYGQPVIVQEYAEAIEWIRKDEQAHGHRQAHQDARTGTAGSPLATHQRAAYNNPRAFFSLYGTRVAHVALDDPATRPGKRTRTHLKRTLDVIDRIAIPYTIGFVAGSLSAWLVLL